jgi:hypothetical protein
VVESASRGPDTSCYPQALAAVLPLVARRWLLVGALNHGIKNTEKTPRTLWPRTEAVRLCLRGEESPVAGWLVALVLALAALFHFSPWPALTVASGLALAALILWRLELGLVLVAAAAPFYLHPRALLGKAFSMVEWAVLLSALAWGLRLLVSLLIGFRNRRSPEALVDPHLLCALSSISRPSRFVSTLVWLPRICADRWLVDVQNACTCAARVLILEPAFLPAAGTSRSTSGASGTSMASLWALWRWRPSKPAQSSASTSSPPRAVALSLVRPAWPSGARCRCWRRSHRARFARHAVLADQARGHGLAMPAGPGAAPEASPGRAAAGVPLRC